MKDEIDIPINSNIRSIGVARMNLNFDKGLNEYSFFIAGACRVQVLVFYDNINDIIIGSVEQLNENTLCPLADRYQIISFIVNNRYLIENRLLQLKRRFE